MDRLTPIRRSPWRRERFLRLLAPASGIAVFAVYLSTLSPGLAFEHYGTDGGDLIAAARSLGVPHPTGYPTYTLLAHWVTLLPIGSLAFRTNLLSALCSGLTVALLCQITRIVLPPDGPRALIACATALSIGIAPLFWSQSVITEVYALLALFAALILWLLLRWRRRRRLPMVWMAALALGVGLGNHLTLAFLMPPAVLLLWEDRRHWLSLRVVLPAGLCFLIGLSVYVYLPLAAAGRPIVNWGDPRTLDRFLWVVTARQYQFLAFGLPLAVMPERLAAWAQSLGDQFGWWGLAIVFTGLYRCWAEDRFLALSGALWLLLVAVYAFFYDTGDSIVYLMPTLLILALWWAYGIWHILDLSRRKWAQGKPLLLAVALGLPILTAGLHWQAIDLGNSASGSEYASRVLEAVAPGSLLVVRRDRPTFSLWYAVYAEGSRSDVQVVNGPMLAFVWYREQMRELYPNLEIPEPQGADPTIDDLIRDLVRRNLTRSPLYFTDPKEVWVQDVSLLPLAGAAVFQVVPPP